MRALVDLFRTIEGRSQVNACVKENNFKYYMPDLSGDTRVTAKKRLVFCGNKLLLH